MPANKCVSCGDRVPPGTERCPDCQELSADGWVSDNELTHRLEAEIRAVRNGLLSDLRVRKQHPSYGVTKGKLQSKLDVLTGMIDAWLYVSGTWVFAGSVLHDKETLAKVKARLGVDLSSLMHEVRAA